MLATSLIGSKWDVTLLNVLSKLFAFHFPETFYSFHGLFNNIDDILWGMAQFKTGHISFHVYFEVKEKKILKKKCLLSNIF